MTKAHKATIAKIVGQAKQSRDSEGRARMDSKTVAKLIKARLALAFPGVKFSVKSDYNSVDIRWDNGPLQSEVEKITGTYSFGGFDGMIDLAYDSRNWLHPDGSMSVAQVCGTEGSRGSVPSVATDCPEPGAFLVEHGPRYVFCHQHVSEEVWEKIVRAAMDRTGHEWNESRKYYDQSIHGDSACGYVRRHKELFSELLAEFAR